MVDRSVGRSVCRPVPQIFASSPRRGNPGIPPPPASRLLPPQGKMGVDGARSWQTILLATRRAFLFVFLWRSLTAPPRHVASRRVAPPSEWFVLFLSSSKLVATAEAWEGGKEKRGEGGKGGMEGGREGETLRSREAAAIARLYVLLAYWSCYPSSLHYFFVCSLSLFLSLPFVFSR